MLSPWARADARAALGEGDMFEQLKQKISARAVRLLRSPLPRRFVSQRKASTTVEFGLLAAPFVALIFAILQTAILFFASQSLETAAATAARLVLTGQAQTQGWTAAQFKSQVCSVITGLFSCQSGVYVDVETYSSFAAVGLGIPVSNGTFQSSSLGYNPGGPGDIVVVRLYYKYPVYVDLFGFSLSTLSGGYNLLAATAVFKNEPYAAS
jgi:Flp pilus assembly protein TadG